MIKLHNSLTRKIEEFKPLKDNVVTMYTCGPTVYDFAHIGNFRTYTLGDLLYRVFSYEGYQVKYAMNVTDVGHLTGDNLGDADQGEDRMEKSAKKEGKSAWDIARFYTEAFEKDYKRLNLTLPNVGEKREDPNDKFVRATSHIKEQIELVKKLIDRGYTYQISDGIYFDTSKLPDYGKLSNLDKKNLKKAERIEPNPEKKNPMDFALWKFSPKDAKRQMEWESPWGVGFPGWHIECSAMSMKYLGETFDIHAGGEDLRSTHHPNEIAQSEAATGKKFVRYWLHGAFILVDGKRMSKSLGNNYKVQDIVDRGFNPIALRYLYLSSHYRSKLNFTWQSVEAAQNSLNELKRLYSSWEDTNKPGCAEFEKRFAQALENDLDMPTALSVVWEMVRSSLPDGSKKTSLLKFDRVLGFNLSVIKPIWKTQMPSLSSLATISGEITPEEYKKEIEYMLLEREKERTKGNFKESDKLRDELLQEGYEVQDSSGGPRVSKK